MKVSDFKKDKYVGIPCMIMDKENKHVYYITIDMEGYVAHRTVHEDFIDEERKFVRCLNMGVDGKGIGRVELTDTDEDGRNLYLRYEIKVLSRWKKGRAE